MAYQPYPYGGYPSNPYYGSPVPDQLAQLRQNQMQAPIMQQPMMQGQQMQQQPQGVPVAPPFQPSGVQNNDDNWVSSPEEANNWLVAPGHSVTMRDVNNRYVYIKSRDANGVPAPLRIFEDTSIGTQQETSAVPQIDLSKYVTIDQLEEILAERLKRPAKAMQKKEEQADG